MTTLLIIETSPRGDSSVSRTMTRRFMDRWRTANPDGRVIERDLAETDLQFVSAPWLDAYFTPAEAHTEEMKSELALSDELVAEVLAADHIAIATPVYNYNVPASLKAWIDHIVRKGITLGFEGNGLVKNTTATLLIASGGVYTTDSPIHHLDIATQYLRLVLGVIGINDVTVVAGGNAKSVDMGDTTMDAFITELDDEIATAATVR